MGYSMNMEWNKHGIFCKLKYILTSCQMKYIFDIEKMGRGNNEKKRDGKRRNRFAICKQKTIARLASATSENLVEILRTLWNFVR